MVKTNFISASICSRTSVQRTGLHHFLSPIEFAVYCSKTSQQTVGYVFIALPSKQRLYHKQQFENLERK